MPKLKFDFTPEAPPEPIDYSKFPAGLYKAVITDLADTPSKAGNPMLTLTVKLENNPAPREKGAINVNGTTHRYWVTLIQSTQFKVAEVQVAVGQPVGDSIDTDRIVGKKVLARISLRSYTNKDGETVVGPSVERLLPIPKATDDDLEDESFEAVPVKTPTSLDQLDNDGNVDKLEIDPTDTEAFREALEEYTDWTLPQLRTEAKNVSIPTAGKDRVALSRALAINDLSPFSV